MYNITVNMTKVVIKILQAIAGTKTVYGRLVVANLLQYMSVKNYENRLTDVKVTKEDNFLLRQCTIRNS